MSTKFKFFLFFLQILPLMLFSQGEFNNWCFGSNRRIWFNSGGLVNMPNTGMYVNGGSISVSDSAGTLLFYSAGSNIYNRNNVVMPNGTGLGGSTVSLTLNTLSVQSLENDSMYFILTGGNFSPNPVYLTHAEYSVMDLRLNGTLGDIVANKKKIRLRGGYSGYGPIAGIRKSNNRDAWVVVRLANTDSNYYAAYSITIAGVDTVPVFSSSLVHLQTSTTNSSPAKHLKISPDGKTLVATYDFGYGLDSLEVCDFNPATGMVIPRFICRPEYLGQAFSFSSVEFSTDSRLLYFYGQTGPSHGYIFQCSAIAPDSSLFRQSQVMVGIAACHHAMPQMGPDWKIYFSPDVTDTLQVINNPSVVGVGCNFQRAGFPMVPGNHADGLPQFLQKYKAYIHDTGNCTNSGVQFSSDIWPPADSIHWDFGDPASGASNFSQLPSVQHVYSDTGTYIVTLFVRHIDSRTDTTRKTIHIMLNPAVDLGPDKTICTGDTATFTASPCNGCSFIWNDVVADTVVSTTSIFRTTHPGIYSIREIQPNGCEGRDTVLLSTTPVPLVTNAPHSDTICSGEQTNILLIPSVTGTNFYWNPVLTSGSVTGFTPDSGMVITQMLFNTSNLPGIVTYNITPKFLDCTGSSVPFVVTVNPILTVSISISPSQNPFCIGAPVTFTATPVNGGPTPVFQWKVNGLNTGTNNGTFSYTPVTGDLVSCDLTSSLPCTPVNLATSNIITMVGNTGLPAGVTIAANPDPFCPGTSVTFTATPLNGGTIPSYQWKVNGVDAGTNSQVFTYNPQDGDSVWCVITSNLPCVSGNPATSAKIIVTAKPAPVVSFAACFDTITTVNAKPITLKGGIPPGGTYSGPGVNSTTGIFSPSLAGTGSKIISYSYSNVHLCSDTRSKNIIVLPVPAFSCGNIFRDVRDNRDYTTVLIGVQCWFAEDLNYGTEINLNQHQRDNCLAEKYHNPASGIQHPAYSYQWDELMQYDESPGSQGLCPPAWHIPTEAEWNILFSNWTNSAFAGAWLKYSGFSGFNALLSGTGYGNNQWNYQDFAVFFWSSTSHGTHKAWAHGMNYYNYGVSAYPSSRTNAFSVRCLRD